MGITASIVVFTAIWFIVLYILLPLGVVTQQDDNSHQKGTPLSAPIKTNLKKKFLRTTLIAFPIWLIVFAGINLGFISLEIGTVFYNN